MIMCLSLFIYMFKYHNLSRLELYGTIFIFGILEVLFFSIGFILNENERDLESLSEIKNFVDQVAINIRNYQTNNGSINNLLKNNYLVGYPKLYNFVALNVDLNIIDENSLIVLDTRTFYNIQHIKPESLSLFINLHRLNDFRWLNRYLINLYEKIIPGGYIVGNLETIEQQRKIYFQKMPNYLAQILYLFDFIFRRVFPKLPLLKQIYFTLTDGKNRALSKAEAFGRLHFCGFTIIAEQEIDNRLYFIAQKMKTISANKNPSYAPIIKLPRIGLNGEIIYIYKFRTMYPYSEYLQEYVYKQNRLDQSGKIKNDFRVTGWGKVLRKLWIDELPQIINWLRGDISLIGVRPLSQHYFNLYPKDLKLLRIQYKPGLIPPYYADMPRSFEDILESERKYLLRKKKKPISTDLIYLFRAIYNIIFKKARSG